MRKEKQFFPYNPCGVDQIRRFIAKKCSIKVSEQEKICAVKSLVAEKLNVPSGQQRLLYKGKALSDEHRLSDYSIGPDSKLNLVVKSLDKPLTEESPRRITPQLQPVWHLLSRVLARHFSSTDAEKILEYVQKDYDRGLRLLSLDDIERLATRLLHPEVAEAVEIGFLD
ncbi:ubiquitin-like protein 4A isoform X3 [Rhinatrema bivittatum]|uniref:ubiquitin-like protein 4A isoform X3 n=1 Tax=Rhinatrema bivittatum TaxID=194408 RepID=UPI00112BF4D2|nr:ubiquitin-like protein 4A isoform X3 [Rhinatrema bivittatum]